MTAVTEREGNDSRKERRQQQSQREKVVAVTKREGNNSHKERSQLYSEGGGASQPRSKQVSWTFANAEVIGN